MQNPRQNVRELKCEDYEENTYEDVRSIGGCDDGDANELYDAVDLVQETCKYSFMCSSVRFRT